MSHFDWKTAIGDVAPILSGVLATVGGPVGMIGGAALKLVSSAILGHPNGTESDVSAAIQKGLTPDAIVALKNADAQMRSHLADVRANIEALGIASTEKQIESVNETMRVEDQTRSFSWRDFWGWMSGVCFAFVVALIGYVLYYQGLAALSLIPQIVGAFTLLFSVPMSVLGVQAAIQTHHDGKAKWMNSLDTGPASKP